MKKNWQRKKLREICDVFTDGNWIERKDQSAEGIRLIQTGNIGQGFFKDRGEKARYISEKTFKRLKCTEIFEGDILISRLPDPVGRACVIPKTGEKMITAVDCSILRLNKNILPKFLNYYSQSNTYLNDVEKRTSGTTRKRISRKNLGLIEIPLPSLFEQHQIVKILDEVLEKKKEVKENTEKNFRNANELFESYSQSVFVNAIDNWEKVEFGEIIELLTDYHANGSYKVLKANVELRKSEDYAWMVRSTDFENNFKNDKRYITKKSYDFLKKSKIFGNEIIICKIGNAGKVYLMPKIDRPCSLAMNSFLIRLNEQKYSSKFVYRFLNSQNGREQIEARILGTTTKTITKENVRSIKIPLPSLKDQKSIVTKLDALSAETKKLEGIYKQKLADLEELKKSVLKKAFNGEL